MIVAGFGFRAAADLSALKAALALAQERHPTVAALAAPSDKLALVERLGAAMRLPVIGVSPYTLRATPTTTRSTASVAARGVGSVAEASALAAAGANARLLGRRCVSPDRMATCAIAQGDEP